MPNNPARLWRRPVSISTVTLIPARRRREILTGIEADAHRNPLHHLDPVAAGILWRQDCKLSAGSRAYQFDRAVQGMVRKRVDVDLGLLAHSQIGDVGFLRVRVDPGEASLMMLKTGIPAVTNRPSWMLSTWVAVPGIGALTRVWSRSRCAWSTAALACW